VLDIGWNERAKTRSERTKIRMKRKKMNLNLITASRVGPMKRKDNQIEMKGRAALNEEGKGVSEEIKEGGGTDSCCSLAEAKTPK